MTITWQLLIRITSISILFLIHTGFLAAGEKQFTVYIAQGEWHTGIILNLDDTPEGMFPEFNENFGYNYIDIGWGERDYYMARGVTIPLALNAILHPTPSVILLMPYQKNPRYIYGQGSRIVKLQLNEQQFRSLCHFITESFVRDEMGSPISAGEPGFYLSKRKYHLFMTCNTWVAMALKRAGLRIRVFPVIMEWQLFAQLERLPGAEFVPDTSY
jgi:uncharacterized protein (TIGR02117 family)